jgi:NCAIR mutase (PurE)-related protein
MNREHISQLAHALLQGQLSIEEFAHRLAAAPQADLGELQLDLDRARRCGFPEVIFGPGKSPETMVCACRTLLDAGQGCLCTRVSAEQAAALSRVFPNGIYEPVARTFRVAAPARDQSPTHGRVVVLTAGTSDQTVALEAVETLRWMEVGVELIQDVGVAGPQRLLRRVPELAGADAVVVVAGMEGALPSVVGGYVDCPVIAVPTSVGYGANLGGLAPLLTMLNSCAANVVVVNIDAGFKGGYVAGMIARRAARGQAAQDCTAQDPTVSHPGGRDPAARDGTVRDPAVQGGNVRQQTAHGPA